jgi:hypothetical protein
LFARFVLETKLESVRYTNSVTTVVQFGDTVPSIPAAVIEKLQEDLEELKSKVLTDAPEEGEDVEVADGALKGLTGEVTRVLPAKQRVQVLLDFMGRATAVELSFGSLLCRRREAASLVLPRVEGFSEGGGKYGEPVEPLAFRAASDRNANLRNEASWLRGNQRIVTSERLP